LPPPVSARFIGPFSKDGRDVAIKVQYPGIDSSIDSDVANVGGLVRMSGLIPKGFDLAPYMEEARKQLHEETDYSREGACLQRFAGLLKDSDDFVVPEFHDDWSTPEILVMSYLEGQPIEAVTDAAQDERNRIAAALIDLTLREVFEFNVTQSDPNFANYRYDAETGKIILLDFGATRDLDAGLAGGYQRLMRAGLEGDMGAMRQAAIEMQFIEGDGAFDDRILAMIQTVFDAIRSAEVFDFADRTLSNQMNEQGMALAEARYVPPRVPMDVLYLQRKFGGMFLLCSRLRAALPLGTLLQHHLQ
jgi:predicted unusual protein kinase regulating ubiquinone biosynthesis (AarF/ABC1/UbiB family)